MSIAKNNTVTTTHKTNAFVQPIEALENRQMMSASVPHVPAFLPADVQQATVHANKSHANTNHGASNGTLSTLTLVRTAVVLPPPTIKSVTTTVFVEPKTNWDVTQWHNFSSNPLFNGGVPSPKDVAQGQVGDCWFLATLAEVAKTDPYRIESSIFERADGTYDVYFHTSPTAMIDEHVDGKLPENKYGSLEYAKLGQGGCTWVAIMEKAFTYFRDRSSAPAYSTIAGGSAMESMKDLGGTPSDLLPQVHTGQDLFNDVVWGLVFNTSMTVGTRNSSWGPLVGEHEYSVISARVYNGVQQIELRNPWGYNPNFTASANYDWTNDGYIWVNASAVLPQLDEFVTAAM
ncbi:MAG TPA: C2 family cysteine protease [Humisphaera sp.]|jgi:hypothetical protein|nr:C2 family cysteine protease [Humisphaera sp.]